MKLSVIIPVYNEEKTVLEILKIVSKVKLSIDKEIVIVNDGSTDRTGEIIKKFIKNSKNPSKFKIVEK